MFKEGLGRLFCPHRRGVGSIRECAVIHRRSALSQELGKVYIGRHHLGATAGSFTISPWQSSVEALAFSLGRVQGILPLSKVHELVCSVTELNEYDTAVHSLHSRLRCYIRAGASTQCCHAKKTPWKLTCWPSRRCLRASQQCQREQKRGDGDSTSNMVYLHEVKNTYSG